MAGNPNCCYNEDAETYTTVSIGAAVIKVREIGQGHCWTPNLPYTGNKYDGKK